MTGCEEEFLAPLPVSFLPGIEPKILEHLTQFNLRLIKDLNKIPASTLATALGPSAYEISRHSRGIDDTPVRESVIPAPSVCESLTLGEQTNDEYEIGTALFHLVTVGAAKVRKMGLAVSKIKLSVLYADGIESTRTVKLQIPLRGDLSLYEQCQILLKKIFTRRVRITVLSAEFLDLIFPYGQIDIFMDSQREENLMTAIDSIRNSFGEKAIKFWGRQQVA